MNINGLRMSSPPILRLPEKFEIGLTGRDPIVTATDFVLPGPGTYTLEGPNGSGKSLFIRMLTGTLPGAVNKTFAPAILIDGKRALIENYRSATRAGVIAIFQDDDLISSMTVFEYLVLVHSTTSPSDLRQYAWDIVFSWIVHPISAMLRHLGPLLPAAVHEFLERLEPKRIDWKDRRALRAAAEKLLKDHGVSTSILDQIPGRLSGGGRASARIISAQLHKSPRVLLLDEAFNSVEQNVWPRFLETIKKWAHERSAAVLAISHNPEEIAAWEPRVRFEISNGLLREASAFEHAIKRRFGRPRQDLSPVYEIVGGDRDARLAVYNSLWGHLRPFERVVWVTEGDAFLGELDTFLPPGIPSEKVHISPSELASFGSAMETLLSRVSSACAEQRSVIVVAGGERLRAVASFCALLDAHVDVAGVVIVLTSFVEAVNTILSNNVSMHWRQGGDEQQLVIATANYNPAAYLVSLMGLENERPDLLHVGFIKCLRLGLLFDADLFRETCAALSAPRITTQGALSIFNKSIAVLNQLADIDATTVSSRQLLEMGNSQSACLLRASTEQSNEASVRLLGLVLNLILTNSNDLTSELIRVFREGSYPVPDAITDEQRWVNLKCNDITLRAVKIDKPGKFNISLMRASLAGAVSRKNSDISQFVNDQMKSAIVSVKPIDIRKAILDLRTMLQEP